MRFQSLLAILTVAPLLGAASEPVRLAPASKWVLDYGDKSCRLIRTFGDPAEPTVLVFERASPRSGLSMVAIGKALKPSAGKEEVTARFLPVENIKFDSGRPAKSADQKDPAVLWSHVDFVPVIEDDGQAAEALQAELKKAMDAHERGERPPPRDLPILASKRAESQANAVRTSAIEISARRNRPVILETGSLGRPIKMLYDCSRHQLRGWGLDPDVEEKIVRPVWAAEPSSWFTSDDYPMSRVMRNEESVVQARLLVDATGKITKCTALSHIDAPEFQKAVCDAYTKRGRFEPAELADGTKVPSYYVQTTIFRMPR